MAKKNKKSAAANAYAKRMTIMWALQEYLEHLRLEPEPEGLRQFTMQPNPTRMVVMPSDPVLGM
jgi:hypothetical protein